MAEQRMTMQLELPPEMDQQDIWNLEEQVQQVEGVTTDLQEPRDLVAATLLFIHSVSPYLGAVSTAVNDIKAIHSLAQILYKFLHPAKTEQKLGANKVVIIKKGKRIELYNLSLEEIEKVLTL